MRVVKPIIYSFFLAGFLVMFSCSGYQKLLKSSDYEAKYKKALEYYEDEDYYRSQSLLEELVTIYKGTDKSEEAYYYYTYCYYYMDDYLLAAYHFKVFAQTYPNSKYAEECSFLSAYCNYLNSPNWSLDQSDTHKAIDGLQLFINRYPVSERKDTCNVLIDKLRFKLEKKSFENAKLYYQIGDYKAAITTIKTSLNDYPDSEYRQRLMFLLLKSNYLLAEKSINSKQADRYQSTINEYYAFIDEFPESNSLKEAEKMYDDSIEKLKKF